VKGAGNGYEAAYVIACVRVFAGDFQIGHCRLQVIAAEGHHIRRSLTYRFGKIACALQFLFGLETLKRGFAVGENQVAVFDRSEQFVIAESQAGEALICLLE
jgi:hypothetical protein